MESTWNLRFRSKEELARLQEFARVNFGDGRPKRPAPRRALPGVYTFSAPPPSDSGGAGSARGEFRGSGVTHPNANGGSSSSASSPPRAARRRGRPSKQSLNDAAFAPASQPAPRDQAIYFDPSGDVEVTNYAPRKRPRRTPSPVPLAPTDDAPFPDDFSILDIWEPGGDATEDFEPTIDVDMHRDGSAAALLDADGDINDVVEADSLKRKRYTSSDDPMKEWLPWCDQMQDEALRRHGLGDATYKPECSSCGALGSDDIPLYCCRTCGEFLECEGCCVQRHQRSPLHLIDVWEDGNWETTSLTELGLVYQIGHQGSTCPAPDLTDGYLTVMHYPAVHTVHFRYCRCSRNAGLFDWQQLFRNGWYPATTHSPATCATIATLNYYRRLKVIANVSVRDFVTTLENTTNPYGTDWVPDRYKAFGRMSRQWSYMQRVRRSGVAHEPGGVKSAVWGSVAVKCWACPRPGVNLPEDIASIPDNEQYKFRPVISVDANFKMKCKMRPSPREDPPLYSGLGVQVAQKEYHEWLQTYITEEEISSCIAFAALMNKENKFSTGLRWTGVVGVVCARHELMLAMGDLPKGERYKNTDFVVCWVLALFMGLAQIAITYDIACQYQKNWEKRVPLLPAYLTEGMTQEISWALPVWHGNVHEVKCETENSARYQVGLGKTDGEAPERLWSLLNPISYMTREEQPGARHDDHEDKVNSINFHKNIDIGKTLLRRLRIAYEERATQVSAFVELDSALEGDLRSDWMAMVTAWLEDRRKPNPYAPSGKVSVSETKVRAELRAQEQQDLDALERDAEMEQGEDEDEEAEQTTEGGRRARGGQKKTAKPPAKRKKRKPPKDHASAQKMTPASFLIMGLQLEDTMARLQNDRSASVNLTLAKESKIHERSKALVAKLKTFRRHQEATMPGAASLVVQEETRIIGPRLPETTILFLPSQCLMDGDRIMGMCTDGLYDMEASLRKGRCSDALMRLRARLMTRRHFVNFRNGHVTGQNETTRAARLIQSLTGRVNEAVRQYRDGRERLLALVGEDAMEGFLELKDADVELVQMEESDAESTRKLARAGTGARESRETTKKTPKEGATSGESRRVVSWIWGYGGGPNAKGEEYLRECVRIEWCKALARKTRWSEEVEILREEMRRVLRTLKYEEDKWLLRADIVATNMGKPEQEGRAAYARRQAKDRARISDRFREEWLQAAPPRGRKAGPMDSAVLQDIEQLLDDLEL